MKSSAQQEGAEGKGLPVGTNVGEGAGSRPGQQPRRSGPRGGSRIFGAEVTKQLLSASVEAGAW